ncbi:MAG: hypothetical protein AAEJ04_05295, partial [Planctomycetota bacterium]
MVATISSFDCQGFPSLPLLRRLAFSLSLLILVLWCSNDRLAAQCLPTSWVITGTVIDGVGNGVSGIDVDIIDPFTGLGLSLGQDVTLADGSFTLVICEAAPAGFYDFLFQTAPAMPYFDLLLQTVDLSGSTDLGTVVLDDASVVSGRVVGESGVALTGVDLDFFDPLTGQETVFSGDFTDNDGIFSVKVISDFWDIRFSEGPGTSTVPLVPRLVSDVAVFDAVALGDVLLREGHPLVGLIQDSNGDPVSGADIDVRDPITDEKFVTSGDNTNGSGIFEVLVPSGSWELEVDPPQGSSLVSSLSLITVPVGGVDLGVLILPAGFTVGGTVVNVAGAVIPDTDLDFFIAATGVEIPTAHDNANSSGVFSVQVVPDTYDIAFRPRFFSGAAPLVVESVTVDSETNLGTVTLPIGLALTGTVVAGTVPVGEVEITLNDSATGIPVYVFGNDTDGLGAYALRQVPGTYDLTATPLASSGFPTRVISGVVLDTDINLPIDLLGSTAPTPPDPVVDLECSLGSSSIELSWTLGNADYDSIRLERNDVFLVNLPGDTTSFSDQFAPQEILQYSATAVRGALTSSLSLCSIDNSPATPPAPVVSFECLESTAGVGLGWQLGDPDYDLIEIFFDGQLLEVLSGQATDYFHNSVTPGIHLWGIVAQRSGLDSEEIICSADVSGSAPPLPVSGLNCLEDAAGVELQWQLGDPDYDSIQIYFDGVLLEVISGLSVSYSHDGVIPGVHQWSVIASRSALDSTESNCSVDVTGGGPLFVRGDANADLTVNVADAVFVLAYLFIQGPSGSCLDSLD